MTVNQNPLNLLLHAITTQHKALNVSVTVSFSTCEAALPVRRC